MWLTWAKLDSFLIKVIFFITKNAFVVQIITPAACLPITKSPCLNVEHVQNELLISSFWFVEGNNGSSHNNCTMLQLP
jgi:hypothetical protein